MSTLKVLVLLPVFLLIHVMTASALTYNITFSIEMNISAIENDTTYLGRNYACIQDGMIKNVPSFALVSAGKEMNSFEYGERSSYFLSMNQNYTENRFLIPASQGGCHTFGASFQPTHLYSFFPYRTATEIILKYPVNIVGRFSRTGSFTIALEKREGLLEIKAV
ncbi:MAG: hypothetical protein V1802_01720 [Candidatus Aenigmatarchaeota archaeon]